MDIVQLHVQLVALQQNIIAMMKLLAKEQQEVGVFRNTEEAVGAPTLLAQLILVQKQKRGTAEMKLLVKAQVRAGAAHGANRVHAQLVQNPKYGTVIQKKLAQEQEQTGAQASHRSPIVGAVVPL